LRRSSLIRKEEWAMLETIKREPKLTEVNGIPFVFLHTSGHATLSNLKRLAKALSPQVLIPIHSYYSELFSKYFANVHCLEDGGGFEI
jgi:mRNA degradation ribonuclease J1/J2